MNRGKVSCGWQFNDKEAPGTEVTLDGHPATVGLGDTLDDGQAQPTAAGGCGGAAIEPLKDVLLVVWIYARTAVPNPETDDLAGCLGADLNLSTGRSELKRIVQQVAQGQFDTGTVALDLGCRLWQTDGKVDLFFPGQRPEGGRSRDPSGRDRAGSPRPVSPASADVSMPRHSPGSAPS